MKKIAIYYNFLCYFSFVYAQTDTLDSEFTRFYCRGIEVNVSSSWDIFSGIGFPTDLTSTPIDSLYPLKTIPIDNPSWLGFCTKKKFTLDVAPMLPVGFNTIGYDVEKITYGLIDTLIRGKEAKDMNKIYPTVTDKLKIGSSINNIGISIPIPPYNGGFSFSFQKLLGIGLGTYLTGIETGVRTTGAVEYCFSLFMAAEIKVDFDLTLYRTSFAFGRKFSPSTAFGISADLYSSYSYLDWKIDIEGVISKASPSDPDQGTDVAFESPNSPYNDTLSSWMNGEFSGRKMGIQLGFCYHFIDKKMFTNVILSTPVNIDMGGKLRGTIHSLPALDMGSEKPFDMTKLDVSRLTKTRKETIYSSHLNTLIPGRFTTNIAHKTFLGMWNLTYTCYFGNFGYEYKGTDTREINDTTFITEEKRYSIGLKLKHSFIGGIRFSVLRINSGVLLMDVFKNFEEGEDIVSHVIPIFDLGVTFNIIEAINFKSIFVITPFPTIKIATTYMF
jgi:hypothetical protein